MSALPKRMGWLGRFEKGFRLCVRRLDFDKYGAHE